MSGEPEFTAEQAAAANRRLRAALGLEPQRFPLAAFVGMISDEIEQLRAAGRDDAEIARLASDATGADIPAEAIARFYAPPDERGHPG